MSDQINEFDQIFRDKLSGQAAPPPPAVWDNIQNTRTFGHVVANRISNNWRIFGTLLMLLLAGGSSIVLLGEEENNALKQYHVRQVNIQPTEIEESEKTQIDTRKENDNLTDNSSKVSSNFNDRERQNAVMANNQRAKTKQYLPSADVLASLELAGFTRPYLENERLSAYIETLNGWENAKPISFVRYFHLDALQRNPLHEREEKIANPRKVEIDYDYVLPRVERKTFKERASFIMSITPHSIHKSIRAEYNLSSSFIEDRKKAESTRLAFTLGAGIQYEIQDHKFLEFGINYTQIHEEVSFEGETRFSNQYNFIEIPVLMGYGDRSSKWGWHVKGGFGVQVYNTYQGYTLKRVDEFGAKEEKLFRNSSVGVRNIIENNHTLHNDQARNEVVNLENKSENPYKTSGVVNLHLAAGLTYYHSIKTSFLITPSYRRSINSISKEKASFTERITYTGISFGARVKF